MKIFHFGFRDKGRKSVVQRTFARMMPGFRVEKFLFITAIVMSCLLILSQIVLTNETARTFLTGGAARYEGIPIEDVSSTFKQGTIEVELSNYTPGNKVVLLVNGEEAQWFKQQKVVLEVKDNDLIEVDTTRHQGEAIVRVTSVSSGINTAFIHNNLRVEERIAELARIKIE